MRIAFLTGSFSAYSGIERQVQYQAEEYVTAGHDVSVFTFEADMQPTARYSLQILGMPQNLLFHRIARLLYPMLFWVVRRHLRYVRDFDLVIAHQYPLTVLAAKAKKHTALVLRTLTTESHRRRCLLAFLTASTFGFFLK